MLICVDSDFESLRTSEQVLASLRKCSSVFVAYRSAALKLRTFENFFFFSSLSRSISSKRFSWSIGRLLTPSTMQRSEIMFLDKAYFQVHKDYTHKTDFCVNEEQGTAPAVQNDKCTVKWSLMQLPLYIM